MLKRRTDGTYYCRVWENGRNSRRVQFTLGKMEREEAVTLYKRKLAEIAARRGRGDSRMSFATLGAAYLEAAERGESEVRIVGALSEVFGSRPVSSLRAADWRTYQRKREQKDHVSPATCKREFSIFRAVLNHGEAEELIERNPIPRKAIKFEKDNVRESYFTPEEWEAFFHAFDDEAAFRAHVEGVRRFGPRSGAGRRPDSLSTAAYLTKLRETMPFFRALLLTGSRLGEMVRLEWRDVDLRAGIVRISQPKTGETKTVPIGSELRGLFLSLPKGTGAAKVFRRSDGSSIPAKDAQRAFALAKKLSGIRSELTPHSIRHTFGSWLAMEGVPLRTIQELLGHKDIRMTLRYAALSPKHLSEAAEIIGRVEKRGETGRRGHLVDTLKTS